MISVCYKIYFTEEKGIKLTIRIWFSKELFSINNASSCTIFYAKQRWERKTTLVQSLPVVGWEIKNSYFVDDTEKTWNKPVCRLPR